MAIPCRSGNLVSGRCLAVDVPLAVCLAILLEPARQPASACTPARSQVTAGSPSWPCDWLPRNSAAAPRSGRGDGGSGWPTFARSCSQDISGPFMGTGPGGAHATLSSVVVSLMLAYPHSSALDPCSSRFLFHCDLLPSHRGPQLSNTTCPSVSSVSLLHATD